MKIFIGIIALALLTSYVPNENNSPNSHAINTNFFFQIAGSLNKRIKSKMCFETSITKTNREVLFSTLRMDLQNTKENTFVLFISKEHTSEAIGNGTYTIRKALPTSITHKEGVFGYWNIEASEELPFYTEGGKVIITKANKDRIKGYLNMSLKNFNGEKVTISGDFIAHSLN